MKLRRTWMLGVALVLVTETLGYSVQPDADQEAAIAEIKKLGGSVTVRKATVESVRFYGTQVTDAGLEHLRGLTQLRRLYLEETKVTDAGLVHLKGLTKLEQLSLEETRVTDEGVNKLQQALPKCKISH